MLDICLGSFCVGFLAGFWAFSSEGVGFYADEMVDCLVGFGVGSTVNSSVYYFGYCKTSILIVSY